MIARVAVLAAFGLSAHQADAPSTLLAERLPAFDGDAETRQFLAADKKGRIYVLREGPMTVHRLEAGDKLGLGDPIKASTLDPQGLFLTGVAMDSAAEAWLLATNPLELRRFVGGKEKALPPLDFPARALAFVGGTPVVAVEPRAMTQRVEAKFPGEFPLLLEQVGGKWLPLVTTWISAEEAVQHLGTSNYWSRRLASGPENRIWSAHQIRYIVEQFTASGKQTLRVQVGKADVRLVARTAEEKEQIASTVSAAVAGKLGSQRPAYVTKAIAAGREGQLFLLIAREEGGFAIDRLDPLERTLERVLVEGLEGTGFTMAAGSDGLYLGTIAAGEGRWRISWESLVAAKWAAVPGAKFETSFP